jgi:hypothetical protein
VEARAGGISYPILAAQPVLDFIRDVAASGAADVRWHTTWRHDAVVHLAPALGLPALALEDAPEFDAARHGPSGYLGAYTGWRWWKLPAARRAIAAGRVLVWTDDDLARTSVRGEIAEEPIPADTTLLIAPRPDVGLTPRHLRTIAAFLERWRQQRT